MWIRIRDSLVDINKLSRAVVQAPNKEDSRYRILIAFDDGGWIKFFCDSLDECRKLIREIEKKIANTEEDEPPEPNGLSKGDRIKISGRLVKERDYEAKFYSPERYDEVVIGVRQVEENYKVPLEAIYLGTTYRHNYIVDGDGFVKDGNGIKVAMVSDWVNGDNYRKPFPVLESQIIIEEDACK